MAWECVALDLAHAAGITVPARRLLSVGGRNVLLVERFDRLGSGLNAQRVPYLSAMTLLEAADGDWADYVDIAERLADVGSRVGEDLAELFRRVALSVAIGNTDDHLRNHGFLTDRGGWRLAPLFDVNPNPDRRAARATGIGGAVTRSDESLGLVQLAEACRLTSEAAELIRVDVDRAVGNWSEVAARRGIAAAEQRRMAPAFQLLSSGDGPTTT